MKSRKYSPSNNNSNNLRCLVASTSIFLGVKEHINVCLYGCWTEGVSMILTGKKKYPVRSYHYTPNEQEGQ